MPAFLGTEPCNDVNGVVANGTTRKHDAAGFKLKLSNSQGMGIAQRRQINNYVPGEQLIESARFAPMTLSPRVNVGSNPEEAKKVHLLHASIISAIDAEMGRIYTDRLRSPRDHNHDEWSLATFQSDGPPKCSNRPPIHRCSNDRRLLCCVGDEPSCPVSPTASGKTELVQHGLHADSLGLGNNGESSSASEAALLRSVEVEAFIGSVGHGQGLCKPCAFFRKRGCILGARCSFCHLCEGGERKRRKKQLQEYWHTVVTTGASK